MGRRTKSKPTLTALDKLSWRGRSRALKAAGLEGMNWDDAAALVKAVCAINEPQ